MNLLWLIGVAISLVGGGAAASTFLAVARLGLDVSSEPKTKRVPPWLTGIIERLAFTILVAMGVQDVVTAMLAWIALKLATNWNHASVSGPHSRTQGLLALLAGLISMVFAFVGGLVITGQIRVPLPNALVVPATVNEIEPMESLISADWALVLLTLLLAIATIGLFIATQSMAKDARIAANKALGEASRANDIAERAVLAANRAWIGKEKLVWQGREEGVGLLKLTMMNYGNSPAFDLVTEWQVAIDDSDDEGVLVSTAPSDLNPQGKVDTQIRFANDTINEAVARQVLAGERNLWVAVRAKYRVYGGAEHLEKFRYLAKWSSERSKFLSCGIREHIKPVPQFLLDYIEFNDAKVDSSSSQPAMAT